jgi:hypothetical protein
MMVRSSASQSETFCDMYGGDNAAVLHYTAISPVLPPTEQRGYSEVSYESPVHLSRSRDL